MIKDKDGYWVNEPDEVGNGDCRNCPHWDGGRNYCYIYKIFLVAPGYEATCRHSERIDKNP